MSTLTITKKRLSIKAQTLYTIGAIIAAVAVPQIFHAVGAMAGMGNVPGATFLPMHLPIILVGLLAGPWAGAVAGALAPLASFAISGMPTAAILPFMMIELCGYGLVSGLLRTVKLPSVGKVLAAQIGGRVLRFAAVLVAVFMLGNTTVAVDSVWTAVIAGIPGIILQLVVLPLIVFRVENAKKNGQ